MPDKPPDKIEVELPPDHAIQRILLAKPVKSESGLTIDLSTIGDVLIIWRQVKSPRELKDQIEALIRSHFEPE